MILCSIFGHALVQYVSVKRHQWAAFLLAAGEPGMRVALTNSRIMVHQPSGGAQGMASDIEIQAKEILRIRRRLNDLYVKYTGKTLKEIEKAMDRDTFLEADEAKAFGLVDEVFDKRPTVSGSEDLKA
jgi:ATP-dependent Clp protease, protease subunit